MFWPRVYRDVRLGDCHDSRNSNGPKFVKCLPHYSCPGFLCSGQNYLANKVDIVEEFCIALFQIKKQVRA